MHSSNKKIALVGFMGCGKSTLLQRLAPVPGLELADCDHLLEERFARPAGDATLGDYIRRMGLAHFRLVESQVMEQFFQRPGAQVLALGGGGFSAANRAILKKLGVKSLWLNTPFEICFERIQHDHNRPLVALGREKLQQLYRERLSDYSNASATVSPDQWPSTWPELQNCVVRD